jgi:type VI secretion system protein ImpE
MQALELYREGRLSEAIASLQECLRNEPADRAARAFLFELLCFAGEYDRARKHLAALAGDPQAATNTALYDSALGAEICRQDYYRETSVEPFAADSSPAGLCNGRPFAHIADADPRLGAGIEFIASGQFFRAPFEHVRSLEIRQPRYLCDLCWAPATLDLALGNGPQSGPQPVLIPVLYPGTADLEDDLARLGRTTEWVRTDSGAVIPLGQRLLVCDGEEIPLLEIRTLELPGRSQTSTPGQA